MNSLPARRPSSFAALITCIAALFAVPAHAQVDMDAMLRWADATVIRWTVVGDYAGDDLILNVSSSGYAPVTDHVEIAFEYTSEGNGGLVGTPTIVNSPSTMGAIRNGADGCGVPTVLGPYEHATIEKIEDGLGGQLAMTVRTDYPEGTVPAFCTGTGQHSPARSSTDHEDFAVPGIMLLAMGDQMADANTRVSKDKKSIIVKRHGWTYTYTPSKVR